MSTLKRYGLIGYPLTHSYSKKYFTEKFSRENISNCSYDLFELKNINELSDLLLNNHQIKGLNITIPYKESIIPFLNEITDDAKSIGAVNCIKINNNKLIGYNTDVFGFKQSIKPFLTSAHEKALILGTGGSSKAVAHVLNEIGIECFFVTRKKNNPKQFEYDELNEYIFKAFKLIINTTPVGMYPNSNDAPQINYKYINSEHLLYDLVYNPEETTFLKHGKKNGATTINGLSMLYLQAEKSWEIWNS